MSATSDTIAEDAPGSELVIVSLSDVIAEGAQASVIPGLHYLTANSIDLQDPAQAVFDAANAYSGPGSLSYSTTTGVLTYTGGVGGTSMADLLVPIDDTEFEYSESAMVSISNRSALTLGNRNNSSRFWTTMAPHWIVTLLILMHRTTTN